MLTIAYETFPLYLIIQFNPTPLAIKVAKKGMIANPINSVVIRNLNLFTTFSNIIIDLFFLIGNTQLIYVTVGYKEIKPIIIK